MAAHGQPWCPPLFIVCVHICPEGCGGGGRVGVYSSIQFPWGWWGFSSGLSSLLRLCRSCMPSVGWCSDLSIHSRLIRERKLPLSGGWSPFRWWVGCSFQVGNGGVVMRLCCPGVGDCPLGGCVFVLVLTDDLFVVIHRSLVA